MFLPSIREIKEVLNWIQNEDSDQFFKKFPEAEKVSISYEELHGGLSPEEKKAVIKPRRTDNSDSVIRIILATKIAETALTLDRIFYVLDSGLEREYYFEELAKLNLEREVKISKSSAIQRQGRAGRVANGYCFKMYKEEEELKFNDTKVPEILRMDISDVILLQTELQALFQMPSLMYYDKIQHIEEIKQEMIRIKAIETNETDSVSVLSNKGQFIIRSGLDTMVSAFLYECHRYDCGDLGHIASSALKNYKGFFRDNV